MKHDETHTRYIKWEPVAGYGLRRTVGSDDLPVGAYLSSYKYDPWQLIVDPSGTDESGVECFDVDDLLEIVGKLKQLNERDTYGRNIDSERAEVEVPGF